MLKKNNISMISSKGQAIISVTIRRKLKLSPGDIISFETDGDSVRIRKISSVNMEWTRAIESTLTEWNGNEDDDL